ncbi:phosphatase [Sulfurovum sp. XGS-02]|uniref:Ppx/GppA phosphatase family protein n=1 Tax=Sulfurovum sp. XGS-02 TaxID=2925411 RepID=UPI00206B5295|nr:phosphatase [Sulfurovum sp. XGS-02]UPT77050.1 phosphatase [Sulfurovum sp. XGS-02]
MIAIDLGSNTLRVLEYECSTGTQTAEFEKIVKTADGLVQYGVINNDAVKRVISAILEAQQQIDFSSSVVRAVTTEAVRRAVNSDEVLAQIQKETGVHFDIISGEEEARLTLLAVKHRLSALQVISESFVLIDIGGGSTELIFHYGDETISKSFPLGIVTIAQTYETLEKIEKALPKEMAEMQRFCEHLYDSKGKINTFVATAGTPTTVAAMKLGQNYETYDASKINGTSLEIDELDLYLKKLLSMPFEQREIAVGTGRSDLIAAGILIYKQLFRLLGFESGIVIDDGLREGVAIEACGHQAH